MRTLLIAVVVIAMNCSTAIAGPKEDALQVLDNWTKAFTASDVDGIVKLYAPDVLFFGTRSKALVAQPGGVRKYFERALLSRRPRGAKLDSRSAMVVSDTVVVVSGIDTLSGVRDGKPYSVNGRVTFVVAKRGPEWQIVQFHRSPLPK